MVTSSGTAYHPTVYSDLPRFQLPTEDKTNSQAPQRRGLGLLPGVFLAVVHQIGGGAHIHHQCTIIGGDDGKLVNFEPKAKHPGFPRTVLLFDLKTQKWTEEGEVPFSLVTTNAVIWNGQVVVPGGEARPGVRSPQVWAAPLK